MLNISTPSSIIDELKKKYKQKRLILDLTQEGLSDKSSVSLGSIINLCWKTCIQRPYCIFNNALKNKLWTLN